MNKLIMNNLYTDNFFISEKDDSSESPKKPICEICFDDSEENLVDLKCTHKFHYDCVLNWYCKSSNLYANSHFNKSAVKRQCPYCRQDGGYLDLPKDHKYIHGIHEPKYDDRKRLSSKKTGPDTGATKIELNPAFCKGIAKSTKKQCKKKGKEDYGGYCFHHKHLANVEEESVPTE